jgi:hypothetical protein
MNTEQKSIEFALVLLTAACFLLTPFYWMTADSLQASSKISGAKWRNSSAAFFTAVFATVIFGFIVALLYFWDFYITGDVQQPFIAWLDDNKIRDLCGLLCFIVGICGLVLSSLYIRRQIDRVTWRQCLPWQIYFWAAITAAGTIRTGWNWMDVFLLILTPFFARTAIVVFSHNKSQ